MQHIKVLQLRLVQVHAILRHIDRAQVDRTDSKRLAFAYGILPFHPDMGATSAAEVPMDCFDARRVVAELRARGRRVESEVGCGGEAEVRCSQALAEGAVAACGGEVAVGVECDVSSVSYEADDVLGLLDENKRACYVAVPWSLTRNRVQFEGPLTSRTHNGIRP
jgi:hypothetical protein